MWAWCRGHPMRSTSVIGGSRDSTCLHTSPTRLFEVSREAAVVWLLWVTGRALQGVSGGGRPGLCDPERPGPPPRDPPALRATVSGAGLPCRTDPAGWACAGAVRAVPEAVW